MEPGSNASPALERGLAFGVYVLVQAERASEDEQVWLARTAALPPSPVTARFRGRPAPGAPSPFGQEAQLGKWLQHPSLDVATEEIVVGAWTCAISAGAPGVPLSQLGSSLAALRANDEAQWAAIVAHILSSLLAGLDFAHRMTSAPGHAKGVVHGGVRPAVVAVGADGSARLSGFGVVRDDDPSRVAERGMEAIAYAAPEQFGTRGRAASMDLWSLGAVLHELIDARPFRGEHTDVRALYRIALAGEVAPLSRPAPEPLERMRAWLLATSPRDRPRSAAEALAAMGARAPTVVTALGELVRVHRAGGAQHSVPPPAAVLPAFAPPAAMPPPQPPFAPAFASPPRAPAVFVEEEGTVELDQAVLAAMRAGTRPPSAQPSSAQPQPMASARGAGELMMPPPAARSSRSAAPQRAAPIAPAQPPTPVQHYPASPHYPAPAPQAPLPRSMPPAAAPRSPSPPHHDHGPLELHPTYEPTTMTVLQARKSTRNFVLIIVIGAVLAIVVGVGVGYLIVSDDAATPSKAAPKPNSR